MNKKIRTLFLSASLATAIVAVPIITVSCSSVTNEAKANVVTVAISKADVLPSSITKDNLADYISITSSIDASTIKTEDIKISAPDDNMGTLTVEVPYVRTKGSTKVVTNTYNLTGFAYNLVWKEGKTESPKDKAFAIKKVMPVLNTLPGGYKLPTAPKTYAKKADYQGIFTFVDGPAADPNFPKVAGDPVMHGTGNTINGVTNVKLTDVNSYTGAASMTYDVPLTTVSGAMTMAHKSIWLSGYNKVKVFTELKAASTVDLTTLAADQASFDQIYKTMLPTSIASPVNYALSVTYSKATLSADKKSITFDIVIKNANVKDFNKKISLTYKQS